MFGRRPDATLVKQITPLQRFMPFVSPRRNEALVLYAQTISVDAAFAFIEARNAHRPPEKRLTLFHVILRAIALALDEKPRLNRFVKGSRLWQRDGIWLTFSAKRAFADDASVITVKRRFNPKEDLEAMADGVLAPLSSSRSGKLTTSEKEMGVMLRLPLSVLRFAMWFAAKADDWGLMPGSMIHADPLYTSAFIANLGSVGLEAGYHHLWEWGTCPIFCVIGHIAETPEGRKVTLKWTYDERTADAFYAVQGIERVRHHVENPS